MSKYLEAAERERKRIEEYLKFLGIKETDIKSILAYADFMVIHSVNHVLKSKK